MVQEKEKNKEEKEEEKCDGRKGWGIIEGGEEKRADNKKRKEM